MFVGAAQLLCECLVCWQFSLIFQLGQHTPGQSREIEGVGDWNLRQLPSLQPPNELGWKKILEVSGNALLCCKLE